MLLNKSVSRETTRFHCEVSAVRPCLRKRLLAGVLASCLLAISLFSALDFAFADDLGNKINTQQQPDSSFIYDTPIAELANADSYYDKQTVQVRGEVVGDLIWDGLDRKNCWIMLASIKDDDHSTISVFLTAEQAAQIDTFGRFGVKGTILQVKGTFLLVSNEHQGATELNATDVSVVAKGKYFDRPFNLEEFLPGIVLVIIGLIFSFGFNRLVERGR